MNILNHNKVTKAPKRKSKLQDVIQSVFNPVSWADRYFDSSEDMESVIAELYRAYPNFKSERSTDENQKEAFEKIKFTLCKKYCDVNPASQVYGYHLLDNGKWNQVSKEDFENVANDDTRIKGTSLNLSLDSEFGIYQYTQKPIFMTNLEKKNPIAFEKFSPVIFKVKEGIRSKVRTLDNSQKTKKDGGKRNSHITRSQSLLNKLSVWEGDNFRNINNAIDKGDAIGLAWKEIKPRYLELKKLFKDITKRENQEK
jgi:hypothetical protein